MRKDPYFVDLTPQLIGKAQKMLDFISSEGSAVNGVDETIDTKLKPDWYDEERFRKGQLLAQKHYAAYVHFEKLKNFDVKKFQKANVPL